MDDLIHEQHELPSDDDGGGDGQNNVEGENLFGDEAHADGDAGGQDGQKIEPKKRAVRNPRPRLTVETLRGPRGIQTIEQYFQGIKFRGRGHERHDLDEVMRRMQHWAHRMYPNYKLDDVLNNIERLNKKKPLQVHMSRYRLGMLEELQLAGGDAELQADDDDGANAGVAVDEPFDEFDALLGEQIAISRIAPHTPASSVSSRYDGDRNFTNARSTCSSPGYSGIYRLDDTEDLINPLPTTQPTIATCDAPSSTTTTMTEEQLARMQENKRVAQERLRAKRMALAQQNGQGEE